MEIQSFKGFTKIESFNGITKNIIKKYKPFILIVKIIRVCVQSYRKKHLRLKKDFVSYVKHKILPGIGHNISLGSYFFSSPP